MAKRSKKPTAKQRISKAVKASRKSVKKTIRAVKKLRTGLKKATKKRQVEARKVMRAKLKAITQIDLSGSADISGSVVRDSNSDPGASRPGEPPKMRTGKGRSSIKAQLRMSGKKLNSRVYVDKKIAGYMAMWEFRKDGKGRPFLKPAVEDNKETFGKIIGKEIKQVNRGGKKKAVVK